MLYPTRALAAGTIKPTKSSKALSLQVWHQRLGHLHVDAIKHMAQKDTVKGLTISRQDDFTCGGCHAGKSTRLPFKPSTKSTQKPLQLVHSDLIGPFEIESIGGSHYWIHFLDDFSRLEWGKALRTKDQAFDAYKEYKAWAEAHNEGANKLKILRTDNGGEYTSGAWESSMKADGVEHQTSNAHTPEQNGRAERSGRTLTEGARTLLQFAGLSKKFWAEAYVAITHLCNRSKHSVNDLSPYELFTGKKPDIGYLRAFGCAAYVHIPEPNRKKLDSKSWKCVMIGYNQNTKGYRCWDIENRKIRESRDIRFDETDFPMRKEVMINPADQASSDSESSEDEDESSDTEDQTDSEVTQTVAVKTSPKGKDAATVPLPPSPKLAPLKVEAKPAKPSPNPPPVPRKTKSEIKTLKIQPPVRALDTTPRPSSSGSQSAGPSRPRRGPQPSAKMKDILSGEGTSFKDNVLAKGGIIKDKNDPQNELTNPNLSIPGSFESEANMASYNLPNTDGYIAYAFNVVTLGDPKSYKEACSRPDSDSWLEAMQDEINSLASKQVWTLGPLPPGRKPLKGRWVY